MGDGQTGACRPRRETTRPSREGERIEPNIAEADFDDDGMRDVAYVETGAGDPT